MPILKLKPNKWNKHQKGLKWGEQKQEGDSDKKRTGQKGQANLSWDIFIAWRKESHHRKRDIWGCVVIDQNEKSEEIRIWLHKHQLGLSKLFNGF